MPKEHKKPRPTASCAVNAKVIQPNRAPCVTVITLGRAYTEGMPSPMSVSGMVTLNLVGGAGKCGG